MVRDGVLTVPPEYLLLELIDRVVRTPLMTFCHTMAVSCGSAVTTQFITTELPTVTDGTMLAVTDGTSVNITKTICHTHIKEEMIVFERTSLSRPGSQLLHVQYIKVSVMSRFRNCYMVGVYFNTWYITTIQFICMGCRVGSWIYYYLCNQYQSPLKMQVQIPLIARCIRYISDKVCQWLMAGQWFSPGIPVSSTNKTDSHYINEILLKVSLNIITLILAIPFICDKDQATDEMHIHWKHWHC